jgi:hypothetical protein
MTMSRGAAVRPRIRNSALHLANPYSYLKATIGSAFVARRAGT